MLEFWQSVRGKAVLPRKMSAFEAILLDDDEDTDQSSSMPSWQSEIISISGLPLILTYANAKGELSTRLVTCHRLDQCAEILYIWGYCHHREKVRQFRVDRIIDIANGATGELLGKPSDYFSQFQIDCSQRSKPGWGLGVKKRADFIAVLNSLVFMARCDKHYHPLERSALEDCIARYWIRFEAPGDPDVDAILAHADHMAPDAETFFVSLARCAEQPRLVQLVKQSASDIIDADGVHANHEIYWGRKIDEYFSSFGH